MTYIDRVGHKVVFGFDVKELNKGERLQYGESLMTHAMTLTGVHEKEVRIICMYEPEEIGYTLSTTQNYCP